MRVAELTLDDYEAFLALIRRIPEMRLREADSREAIGRYLARNSGLSFAAWDGDELVGFALCGHDGRRGYMQHVAVDPRHRGQGIARQMVTRCLDGLAALGIMKTHMDVYGTNDYANAYWQRCGWQRRDDVYRYSLNRSTNPEA
jgi:ribosomal protein S18 acetylase RimI-like enzyme